MTNGKRQVAIKGDSVHFAGNRILLRSFPEKFRKTIDKFDELPPSSHTLDLEQAGARLIGSGFADKKAVSCFLDNVLVWGGSFGHMVRAKIKHFGTRQKIISSIPKAMGLLDKGQFSDAMKIMIFPKPCGLEVSFGSKILRMLSPQTVGVYDSVLAKAFGASAPSIPAWENLCRDCQDVAAELNRRGKNPLRKNGKWYAADVEAVIFQYIRETGDRAR